MSKLSKSDIEKLASLARLELRPDQIDRYQKEFSEILAYVEQLSSVNTDGLTPTYQVNGLSNVTRPDTELNYGTDHDSLMKNVTKVRGNEIEVNRMIG